MWLVFRTYQLSVCSIQQTHAEVTLFRRKIAPLQLNNGDTEPRGMATAPRRHRLPHCPADLCSQPANLKSASGDKANQRSESNKKQHAEKPLLAWIQADGKE